MLLYGRSPFHIKLPFLSKSMLKCVLFFACYEIRIFLILLTLLIPLHTVLSQGIPQVALVQLP